MPRINSRGVAEAVEAVEASGAAFAATWRDERGEIVGTTFGGTMCMWPTKPWRIRFSGDGFEGVIRCGECPGCLEFDRRRLADRLVAKYGVGAGRTGSSRPDGLPVAKSNTRPSSPALFVVRIFAPLDSHAALSRSLRRRRHLELEPGMYRLGASSFALVSREKSLLSQVLKRLGLKHRIEPLRLSRGRRAFRVLTAGLLVAREVYGEQRDRWYARGLPPADRQKWQVKKIGQYKSYSRSSSPRAWKNGRVVLVPPEVWQLRRTDRRALRGQLLRASDPEGVARVMRLVHDAISNARNRFDVSAAAKPLLSREAVQAWYDRNAERSKARTENSAAVSSITPVSETGGYVSSEHKQGELMPLELARAREKEWRDAKKARAIQESMEIIERMKRKSRGGSGDGGE